MNQNYTYTAAIFCGGKSSRMGQPKEALLLDSGLTMIEHVYRVVKSRCQKVVFVGKSDHLPDSLKEVPVVEDRRPGLGPLGGLQALLSSGRDREYLVVPCDLNRLVPEVLDLLISSRLFLPLLLKRNGELEPMVARYDESFLSFVDKKIDENALSLKGILDEIHFSTVEVPGHLSEALNNVNAPHDFKQK